MPETELTPDTTPAPEAAVELARVAFQKYGAATCWFWRDDPALTTRGALCELIRNLRNNGDRETWLAAREIERCL